MSRQMSRPNADKPTEPALPTDGEPSSASTATTADEPKGHVVEGPDGDTLVSRLPEGVQMHEAGIIPSAPLPEELKPPRDPRAPPKGWVGGFMRCGGCGDFIGNGPNCPKCSPIAVPHNVSMSGLPVMVAK